MTASFLTSLGPIRINCVPDISAAITLICFLKNPYDCFFIIFLFQVFLKVDFLFFLKLFLLLLLLLVVVVINCIYAILNACKLFSFIFSYIEFVYVISLECKGPVYRHKSIRYMVHILKFLSYPVPEYLTWKTSQSFINLNRFLLQSLVSRSFPSSEVILSYFFFHLLLLDSICL